MLSSREFTTTATKAMKRRDTRELEMLPFVLFIIIIMTAGIKSYVQAKQENKKAEAQNATSKH
jgi:hypothetical protein